MSILPVAIPPHGALVALAIAALSATPPHLDSPSGPAAGWRNSPLRPAVLYNSARFVTWPADVFPARSSPLAVCVLGDDPFGTELDTFLSEKTVGGRALVVTRGGHESELAGCHVLFVGVSESKHLERVFGAFGRGVLTVAAIPRFAERGGMIGFVVARGRVGFEINVQAAHDAELDVSSRLLKLARVIR